MREFRIKIGEQDLILEVGKMAKLANGAVFAKYGETAVLATACCGSERKEGLDFVPLSVEYNERYYAAGKIPGGFLKREARPKDKEILVSRLIDRPLRPLFYKSFGRELQVIPTTVSADQIHTPDTVAMVASFAAVMISDIPFNGPVGAVRVASVDGEFIINPTFEQIAKSELDIIVAGSNDGICMVEGGAQEASEERMLEAIEAAEKEIARICEFLTEMAKEVGKEKLALPEARAEFRFAARVNEKVTPALEKGLFAPDKGSRSVAIRAAKDDILAEIEEEFEGDDAQLFANCFDDVCRRIVRNSILSKNARSDGRQSQDIRPITCEIGVLARAHGSSLFTRGETQSLGITTLGSGHDEQIMDDIDGDGRRHFMLHYNFPPYSVGETGRLMTGRREIGHGHLAQRALEPVLPPKDKFPYTIRLVSEILESNGSSSQATICSGSLALLAAGVPIKASIAGIAMGLIKEGDDYAVLSDILGEEDHLGDMDFKVAGSANGITAFQMDIKIPGISIKIMKEALKQAHDGRMHILNIMNETLAKPVENTSDLAPRSIQIKINPSKIGAIIGSGGKTIKEISEKTKAKINISDDGVVAIFGQNRSQAEAAESTIRGIIEEPEEGRVYNGKVVKLMEFGAFIEISPGKEGLCHISKLSKERVNKVEDVLEVNQEVKVKLLKIDQMGRYNLSMID